MGFFKNIFSGISIFSSKELDVDMWIDEYSHILKREMVDNLSGVRNDINNLAENVKQNASNLLAEIDAPGNISDKLDSIIDKNKESYSKKLVRFMDNIMLGSLDDIGSVKGLKTMFAREFENFNDDTKKSYYLLKDYFYERFVEINNLLNAIKDKFNELSLIADSENITRFEELITRVEDYKKLIKELSKLDSDKARVMDNLNHLQSKLDNLIKQKDSLKLSNDYSIFSVDYERKLELEKKISRKKKLVIANFLKINSLLHKFKRGHRDERLIDRYIQDPTSAAVGDVTFEFNRVLNQFEKEIKSFEDIDKDKKHNALLAIKNLLKNDFLKTFVYEFNNMQRDVRSIDSKINRNKLMIDISELDYKIEHLEEKKSALNDSLKEINDTIESYVPSKIKEDLEADLEEFSKKKIIIP